MDAQRESHQDRWWHLGLSILDLAVMFAVTGFFFKQFPTVQGDDFPDMYGAAKLAGTGKIYDYTALEPIMAPYRHENGFLPYLRMPLEAWALKPLCAFPYPVARAGFFIISAVVAIAAILLWPFGSWSIRILLAAWFIPFAYCLRGGQDIVYFLLFAALAARWLARGQDARGGLAVGMCFFKFHMGAGLAILLLATRRWKAAAFAAIAAAIQILLPFALDGRHWLESFLSLSRYTMTVKSNVGDPTVSGILSFFGVKSLTPAVLASLVLLAALFFVSRRADVLTAMSFALVVGLLVAPHARCYDVALVYPLIAWAWSTASPLRTILFPIFFPLLYPLTIMGVLIVFCLVLSIAVYCRGLERNGRIAEPDAGIKVKEAGT